MKNPADEPPLRPLPPRRTVPVVPGGVSPQEVPVLVVGESRWTKVARVFAIVRDILIIGLLAAAIYFGSAILAKVDTADDGVSGIDGPACVSPSTDQWGTFCPETPGG